MNRQLILAYKNEKNPDTKEMTAPGKAGISGRTDSIACRKKPRACFPILGIQMADRFEEQGADGMHDRQRTGRPTKIPKERLLAIEKAYCPKSCRMGCKTGNESDL